MSDSHLRLNGMLTESFHVSSGVRQGDVMSPILFSMFLNDLATGIKDLDCGIQLNDLKISILLYADDIILIAPDEKSLQKMLNYLSNWCRKWRMAVNMDKTKIIHFRNSSSTQTVYGFRLIFQFCPFMFLCSLFLFFISSLHSMINFQKMTTCLKSTVSGASAWLCTRSSSTSA